MSSIMSSVLVTQVSSEPINYPTDRHNYQTLFRNLIGSFVQEFQCFAEFTHECLITFNYAKKWWLVKETIISKSHSLAAVLVNTIRQSAHEVC